MPVKVEILNLGLNNLGSLFNALQNSNEIETDVRVISNASESRGANLMVLPGVGAFGAALSIIRDAGFDSLLQTQAESGDCIMGICLGMQMLCETSEETNGVAGLSLIPGSASKLIASKDASVPHIGWDSVIPASPGENRFQTLSNKSDFYFVHSYAVTLVHEKNVLCHSPFGNGQFVSGIQDENIVGFQFHPEKSSVAGRQLISEVLEWSLG